MANFYDLNDDCIDEMLRNLGLVDLCKFAVTSQRHKNCAETLFARLYASERLGPKVYTLKVAVTRVDQQTVSEINSSSVLLPAFGQEILALEVVSSQRRDRREAEMFMLDNVEKYCESNSKLQVFRLVNFDITPEVIQRLSGLLSNIKALELHQCKIDGEERYTEYLVTYKILLEACPNLEKLFVINVPDRKHVTFFSSEFGRLDQSRVTDLRKIIDQR